MGKTLVSGKKWNKEEARTGEATWQAHQPTTKESTTVAECLLLCGPHFLLHISGNGREWFIEYG